MVQPPAIAVGGSKKWSITEIAVCCARTQEGTLELVHPVTSNQLDCLIANGLRTDHKVVRGHVHRTLIDPFN